MRYLLLSSPSVDALIRSGNQCNHALLFHISWVMVKMLCLMRSLHATFWFVPVGSFRSWVRALASLEIQLNSGAQPASWCHVGVHNLQRLVRCSPSARRCWRNRHATRVWHWASTPWVKCWHVMQASLPRNDNNSPSSTKAHSSIPFVHSTSVLAKDAIRGQVLMREICLRQEMASKVVSGCE